MHKITNLWTFWRNWSSKLQGKKCKKKHPCCTSLCTFRSMKKAPGLKSFPDSNILMRNPTSFPKLQRDSFHTMFDLESLLIYLVRCDSGRPLWNGCTGNKDNLTVVFLALFQVPCHFSEGCWSLCNTSVTYLKSIFILFLKIFFRGRIGIFCCRCYTTKSFCKDYTWFNN